jgi:PKD repeat protein
VAVDQFLTITEALVNEAPTINSVTAPIDPVNVNDQPVSVEVAFSDPSTADTHDVTWDWGDLTSDTQHNATSPASADHIYGEAGVYTVQVTVTDDDGDSDTGSYEFIVIYYPSGGFVSGGGWIDSPAGAYVPDPTLTGKALFGFVSKYAKGASAPTGNTRFRFRVGDLAFYSESYQWLVVNQGGTNAQFKGSGTVNDQSAPSGEAYKFMLWAKDDDATYGDTFRIKIWYEEGDSEVVVYDNGFDQPIGAGNIKVHQGE